MSFRTVNGVMAALFALAVAVQFNDPDPLPWMVVYGAACGVSAVAATRRRLPAIVPAVVGAVALVWGIAIALRVPGLDVYTYMFDAWEMKSVSIEEAREASGLLLAAAWMTVLAVRAR